MTRMVFQEDRSDNSVKDGDKGPVRRRLYRSWPRAMRAPHRTCWAQTKEVVVRGTVTMDLQDAGDRCHTEDREGG